MEIEILSPSGKPVAKVTDLVPSSTILDVKKQIHRQKRKLYPDRQAIKAEPKGKTLSDEVQLKAVDIKAGLYLKDLGPQVAWKTVFLLEYFGPLALYLVTYVRPALLYGPAAAAEPKPLVVHIACACWTFHYGKRLLETLFVHRFSHATMPVRNIFKNCGYYWLAGLAVGYFMNHPLYSSPTFGSVQIYLGLIGFIKNEIGNFSIHMALRNLRPPGTKERRIPVPDSNPFTHLFNYVSCPNYTYEVMSWVCFTIMTQCLPAGLFTLAGFYQMSIWALGKHKAYKKDFPDYPKRRKAIVPFIL